jgi:hypothetical protein
LKGVFWGLYENISFNFRDVVGWRGGGELAVEGGFELGLSRIEWFHWVYNMHLTGGLPTFGTEVAHLHVIFGWKTNSSGSKWICCGARGRPKTTV